MTTNDKYQIWIEADGEKLCLPVNPPKIEIKLQGNNKSMTLAELGEITMMQAPKATTLSLSSFLPAKNYPFSDYPNLPASYNISSGEYTVSENSLKVMPHYYINFFLSTMKSKQPVRLYITGCDFIQYMTIENFQYSQKGGEVGSYDYTLSLKAYKEISVRQVDVKNGKAQLPKKTEKRISTMQRPKTYTVQKGDMIYTIAKKYYGDIADYRKIYNANKKIIGSNPNNIKAGMVLTLP